MKKVIYVRPLVLCVPASLLTFLVISSFATTLCAQEIRIKVLDGRNGHPMKNVCIGITVTSERNNEDLEAPVDNKDGVAVLHLSAGKITAEWPSDTRCDRVFPTETALPEGGDYRISPNAGDDCRPILNHQPNYAPWYSIKEILQHGVVPENHCGKATAQAEPGELILFIRPIPWWALPWV